MINAIIPLPLVTPDSQARGWMLLRLFEGLQERFAQKSFAKSIAYICYLAIACPHKAL